jgi:hypothetical protein
MVFDSEELNHPAALKKTRSVADCQNSLPAERIQIGFQATAFRRANVRNGTPARLRDGFQPHHANRLTIKPFIRC